MQEKIKYPRLDLGQIEAIVNKLGGMDGLGKFLSGELVVVAKTTANNILEFVDTVTVPDEKRFVVDDHFKDGEVVDSVKVFLGDNFKKCFSGKIEENVTGCDIRVHKLLKTSRDVPILYEVGEDNEETYLANLWHFLKLRGGQGGWFLFYIRGAEGTLVAVDAYWRGGGWRMDAYSVEHRVRWLAGDSVCSR